jgi:hypothetical protein
MLKVNTLRPSKHYFPWDIIILDEGHEGHTFIIAVYVNKRWSICNIRNNMNHHITLLTHLHYIIMENRNNIELHLYLRLDRRWKYKCDARASTSQREQYRGFVHLFIGTGRSPCKITFMPFIFSINLRTIYRGLSSLFLLKSVPFSAIEPKLPCAQLRHWFNLRSDPAFHIVHNFIPCAKVLAHILCFGKHG